MLSVVMREWMDLRPLVSKQDRCMRPRRLEPRRNQPSAKPSRVVVRGRT
jgi:hypothetical protein